MQAPEPVGGWKVRERVRRKRRRWLFPVAAAAVAAALAVALFTLQRSMLPDEPPIELAVAEDSAGGTAPRAVARDTQAERLAADSLAARVQKYGRLMRLVVTDPRLVARDITVGTTEIGRDRLRMKAARRDRLAVDVIIRRRDWLTVSDAQLADLVVAEVLRRTP